MKTVVVHTFHGAALRASHTSSSMGASLVATGCHFSLRGVKPHVRFASNLTAAASSSSFSSSWSSSFGSSDSAVSSSGYWHQGCGNSGNSGSSSGSASASGIGLHDRFALGLAALAATSTSCLAHCDDLEEAIETDTHGSEEAHWREDLALGTAMIAFIKNGKLPLVLTKLERLKQIDEPLDNYGSTPLMIASYVGRVKLVDILLKSGADPSKVDSDGMTAAARAASQGHTNVVRRLQRDQRVDLNLPDNTGRAPIHLAVLGAHQATLYWLLKLRVDPDSPTAKSAYPTRAPQHETPLHLAVRHLTRPESIVHTPARFLIMDILLELGADPMKTDSKGDTPMHECARQGDLTGMFMLLARVPSTWEALTMPNKRGDSPMDEADLFAVSHGVLMRFSVLLPKVIIGKVSEFLLSDFARVVRADTRRER